MGRTEKITDFYAVKQIHSPESLHTGIGHYDVMRLDSFCGPRAKPVPYKRRDYYKITLLFGTSTIHYADKSVEVKKQALTFSNPMVPYSWERIDTITSGYFCIFDQEFFHQHGRLNQYPVFQPDGTSVFELNDEQVQTVKNIFERMLDEIQSSYSFKFDLLKTLVYELVHFGSKIQQSTHVQKHLGKSSIRISTLFLDLLERQFPIDNKHPTVALRTASDFATHLAVHVNHLNRAIKEAMQKTTTEVIAERIIQEAKIMLKHSASNISEIAYALGFPEVTHFNNFFKKHVQVSPTKFRASSNGS